MIPLAEIFNFFEDQKSLIEKGEKAVNASDIQQFSYDPESCEVNAKVHASMRNVIYSVKIIIFEGKILFTECECRKGLDKCHHMAATLIYASKNVSCTDRPCVWNAQKPTKKRKDVEELLGRTKSVLKKKPTNEDRNSLRNDLKENAPKCGLLWLMSDQNNGVVDMNPPKSFDIIVKTANNSSNKLETIIENMKLNEDEINDIFSQTVGQRNNSLWGIYRKGRITASNFGLVLKAMQKSSIPPSTLKTLNGEYNLEGVKAVQWGVSHEAAL